MSEDDINEIRARLTALDTLQTPYRYAEMRALITLIPQLLLEIERLTPGPDGMGAYIYDPSDRAGRAA